MTHLGANGRTPRRLACKPGNPAGQPLHRRTRLQTGALAIALATLFSMATWSRAALAQPAVSGTASTITWPYTDFGTPSAILARVTDTDLGITTVHFANGTRLAVKSTPLQTDRVSVHVHLGSGRAGLKPEQAHALWALDTLPLGGTGQRSMTAISQWLQVSGKQLSVSLRADPQAFVLVGHTRPADLPAQLQVLAAFARDPGFRPELGKALLAIAPRLTEQQQANPGVVYGRELLRILSGGDPRLADAPSSTDVAATRPEDIPAILREPLASAADVVIVGDVPIEAAISAVQATFGAGERRPRPQRGTLTISPPIDGGSPHVVTHGGSADQAVIGWHWPMPDHWADPPLAATGKIAAAVLQARLGDVVRSQFGVACTPRASSNASLDIGGKGSFSAELETPVRNFEAFRQLLAAQMQDLALQPIAEDELKQARQPLVEARRQAMQTLEHWAHWMAQVMNEPRTKDAMQSEIDGLERITVQQVQSFFRDGLTRRIAIEVIARPPQP